MTSVYYHVKCIGTAMVLLCYSASASAQYMKKEQVKNITQKVAVIYGDGLPVSALWPLGTNLMNASGTATIRHQTTQGNSGNKNVNSRVSQRFIVAPTDGSGNSTAAMMWAEGTYNSTSGNNDLNADFATLTSYNTGCSALTTGGRKWRLPTQRELQLMWLFREAIDVVYPSASSVDSNGGKMVGIYWSSTEYNAINAWTVTFDGNNLVCKWNLKTAYRKIRCVSDY